MIFFPFFLSFESMIYAVKMQVNRSLSDYTVWHLLFLFTGSCTSTNDNPLEYDFGLRWKVGKSWSLYFIFHVSRWQCREIGEFDSLSESQAFPLSIESYFNSLGNLLSNGIKLRLIQSFWLFKTKVKHCFGIFGMICF